MNHIAGIAAMAALASLLMNPTTGPYTCQPEPQPSHTGLYVGLGVGVAGAVIGTVILVDRNHAHHTIKGCVSSGPDGLQVRDQRDNQTYTLAGVTASTKVGDVVQLHGAKEKKAKVSSGDPMFTVEKMSRDFGPCKVQSPPPSPAM